jgi:hypothetical protein
LAQNVFVKHPGTQAYDNPVQKVNCNFIRSRQSQHCKINSSHQFEQSHLPKGSFFTPEA